MPGPGDGEDIERAFLTADGVNFRRAPDGTIIRALTLGDEVALLGDDGDPIWRHVRIGAEDGYVAGRYLRPPLEDEIEALLRNARDQWVRFEKGRASEKLDPYCQYVGEMWQRLGLSYDGRSKYPNGDDVPWSAAFISFIVGKSGPKYARFKFDASHSVFVHDAIQARLLSRTDRPFWGWRIGEQRPALGDIVARNRLSNAYSYDYAESHPHYKSHSDVVVEVKDRIIRVLGGNVGDTVSSSGELQDYDLDAGGFIAGGQRVIAILKNRAAEI